MKGRLDDTHCTPLQRVQTNVQKVVQMYCGPCVEQKMQQKYSSDHSEINKDRHIEAYVIETVLSDHSKQS